MMALFVKYFITVEELGELNIKTHSVRCCLGAKLHIGSMRFAQN